MQTILAFNAYTLHKQMRFRLKTPVAGEYRQVLARFDRSLLERLSPPGAQVELVRFDGSHLGDIVHIRLTLLGFIKQDWASEIVEEEETSQKTWFTDEGIRLPFFLRYWRHQHIVENHRTYSVIVDEIEYRTPFILFDYLMYPVLYLQFAWRKPIYRKVFGKADSGS